MRLLRRRLTPGESDHELIWLSLSVCSFACAFLWLGLGLPWPTCVFHGLTGLPCVTCGLTRCTIAFLHGKFVTAWLWNPFVFVILCGVILFDLYALTILLTRAPRLRITQISSAEKVFTRLLVVTLLAANWIYLLSNSHRFS
jgi:hypothetical protein